MCKRAIEKAATQTGATSANWDEEKDMLTMSFDPATTSVDAIQKAVAMSGYDNAGFRPMTFTTTCTAAASTTVAGRRVARNHAE